MVRNISLECVITLLRYLRANNLKRGWRSEDTQGHEGTEKGRFMMSGLSAQFKDFYIRCDP